TTGVNEGKNVIIGKELFALLECYTRMSGHADNPSCLRAVIMAMVNFKNILFFNLLISST
ncbi:hypothetical protein, partial [Bacillus sonorensis]|uniref:hypothetical protein n=1 Tax=Bacillus sonorensis TaxID=119858 RepID=UPI0022823983